MAITVDWGTKVIDIPKADTVLEDIGPPEIRSLDVGLLRTTLKDLEDDPEGMPFKDTHTNSGEFTLSGVTYARFVEIINGYTITFEDGQYVVVLSGANHNIADVKNANQVSIVTNNSAGLVLTGGSALLPAEKTQLQELHEIQGLATGKPMTVTPTSRSVSSGPSQTISGDGETTTTVTRN